jgi:hypothetical protein
MDNISCKIISTNEKLTHWEIVLKKSFKYIPSEIFWILNVTILITIKFLNDWMQIYVQIIEGQENKHLLDYMSEQKDRKNSMFEYY